MQTFSNRLLRRILLTGIIAGTLDAIAAIVDFYIQTGRSPVIIFVYIASAVFGKRAYDAQQSFAIFGVIFHFVIAIIFSAFYFWIYPKMKFLQKDRLASAFLYGILIWFIMNRVVVPLSNAATFPFHIMKALLAALILIVCMGMPISFMAASFYKKNGAG